MPFDPTLLAQARHVVVFTGAGVSAESGIATFRDKLSGLWARFDPAQLASAEGFRADPALVWGWYQMRRAGIAKAEPNAGHLAIAALAAQVPKLTLVTQNVDDLHERAGSRAVLHLHGRLNAFRCLDCARPADEPVALPEDAVNGRRIEPLRLLRRAVAPRGGVVWREVARGRAGAGLRRRATVRCTAVGRHLRPGTAGGLDTSHGTGGRGDGGAYQSAACALRASAGVHAARQGR